MAASEKVGDVPDVTIETALIVDDDADVRDLVRLVLGLTTRLDCTEAQDGFDALDSWHHKHQHVVVLDQMMPGLSGLDVAREILAADPAQTVILFTAFASDETARAAEEIGIRAVLMKSQINELSTILANA
jgi:CheY-like chemotaxis protein